MAVTRIPLVEGIEGRSSSDEKDGLATNVFYDKEGETTYASKRPGIATFVTGSGQAQGIYAYGDDLFSWVKDPYNWSGLELHNGKFIATVNGGSSPVPFAAISSTGSSWGESITRAVNQTSIALASNGTYIVALHFNTALGRISADGLNWSPLTLPVSRQWNSAAYGAGLFVGFAGSSFITSPDGLAWTSRTDTDLTSCITGIFANGRFTVVGRFSGGLAMGAKSTDGINYTAITLGTAPGGASCVAYGNGRWVALLNGTTTYFHSTNGDSWSNAALPITAYWGGITFNGSHFVAVSIGIPGLGMPNGVVIISADGLSWSISSVPSDDVSEALPTIISSNPTTGALAVVGSHSGVNQIAEAFYSIDNGFNWVKTNLPSGIVPEGSIIPL